MARSERFMLWQLSFCILATPGLLAVSDQTLLTATGRRLRGISGGDPTGAVKVSSRPSVPAIFAFGDSSVDTGENNYVSTSTLADFLPYGMTHFKRPTGRFCDGRLVVDFLARAFALPLLPPFLQPGASFSRGASFASAGSGALDGTSATGEVPLSRQLQQFAGLRAGRAPNGTAAMLPNATFSDALYVLSTGSNDYRQYVLDSFLGVHQLTPLQLILSVVSSIARALRALYAVGARRFVVANLPPLGCLPELRPLSGNGSCANALNDLAAEHNLLLAASLHNLTAQLPGSVFVMVDVFGLLGKAVAEPRLLGFREADVACCGAGPKNALVACGRTQVVDGLLVVGTACSEPSKYVFWDYEHTTGAFNKLAAKEFLFGKSFVRPQNISTTFPLPPGAQKRLAVA